MTPLPTWRLDGERAHLQLDELEAIVDVARPHLGVHDLRVRGQAIDAHLLAPRFTAHDSQAVADCFVRGRDLVVTYAPLPAHPVRLQVYWRAARDAAAPAVFAAIDVQVSVQTNLLDAWPSLEIHSRLASRDVFVLPRDAARAVRVTPGTVEAGGALAADRVGCWLCPLSRAGLMYGEMVHPDDVERQSLAWGDAESIELTHHLFAQHLEKGVILRARARGIFLRAEAPAKDATSLAEEHGTAAASEYARFLAAPLPLTV